MSIQSETYILDDYTETGFSFVARMHHREHGDAGDRIKHLPAADPDEHFIAIPFSVLRVLDNAWTEGSISSAQRTRMLSLWVELQSYDIMGLDGSDDEGRPFLYPRSLTYEELQQRTGFGEETLRKDLLTLERLGLVFREARSTFVEKGNTVERRNGGLGYYPLGIRRAKKDLLIEPFAMSADTPRGFSAVSSPPTTSSVGTTSHEMSVSLSTYTDVVTDVLIYPAEVAPKKQEKSPRTNIDTPATEKQVALVERLASGQEKDLLRHLGLGSFADMSKATADTTIKMFKHKNNAYGEYIRASERHRQEQSTKAELLAKQARDEADALREKEGLATIAEEETGKFGRQLTLEERSAYRKLRNGVFRNRSAVATAYASAVAGFDGEPSEALTLLLTAVEAYRQEQAVK
jgi:hypothetical protein